MCMSVQKALWLTILYDNVRQMSVCPSLKLLGELKPNFIWSVGGKGENSIIYKCSRSHEQDGRQADIW